ncbi:MAG: DNA polymerase [Candidatus Paceibacterota bacterium]
MQLTPNLPEAYKLLHDGILAFARAEQEGMRIDVDYCLKKKKYLDRKIDRIEQKIRKTKFFMHWERVYGAKANPDSNWQLAHILYSVRKITPTKYTASGKGATDDGALSQIDLPEIQWILEMRKLKKVRDTYLDAFVREQVDGYLHPFFNLHTVKTFRSCIAEGSKVLVMRNFESHPDGVPIETVQKGDFVYCFDDELRPSIQKVLWAGKTGHKKVVRIHYSVNGGGGKGYLDVTPEHKIRLIDGTYVQARELSDTRLSNKVLSNHTDHIIEYLDEPVDVYDIEVEKYHNFIVNQICVHNSSERINFQNIPKRDKEAMEITRKAIFPKPGHQLLEIDYSGVEVRISECYHHDPVMRKYIEDPTSDMHGDMACQIFILDKLDKSIASHKTMRQAAKNGFVFPQFYGDYYVNCAENIACKWCGLSKGMWSAGQGIEHGDGHLSDHLIAKGIDTYNKFEAHIQKIENHFWSKRFKVYTRWKDKWWEGYQKNGYVSMYTGFRCSGIMRRNECINIPIQGSAFHCLLWSFIQVDRISREQNWRSRLIGQIHDAMVLDVHPDELDMVASTVHKVTCEDLSKHWTWINVPLEVEAEVCPVDSSWNEKQDYHFK